MGACRKEQRHEYESMRCWALSVCCQYVCAVEDCCERVRRSKVGMTKERRVKGVHGAGRGAHCLSVGACDCFGKRSD